jgi:uncharacterized lipoprotein YmbA
VKRIAFLSLALALASCASQPDRFYTLSALPDAPRASAHSPTIHVILKVTVPAALDRREMVLQTSNDEVLILEHERWATTFSDQVSNILGRDMENRRGDVLVESRDFGRATPAPVTIKVDLVQMSARKGASALIEAHWRIVDPATQLDDIASEVFRVPLDGDAYASVARGFSAALGSLADRLASKISTQR